MEEAAQLSALIGGIYDAALEPSLWPSVLGGVAKFVGGPAAALFSKDASSKTGVAVHDVGIDAFYREAYFETYVKLDPTVTAHFFAEIDEPMATVDVAPYDEFFETRFYREWAKPQGLIDCINAVLDKSVTSAAMVCVFRHERDGIADDETRRRMRLVAPHVRRSVLIGRLINLKSTEAETFTGVLDSLKAGMFLIGPAGRIVHANAKGHEMLAEGDPLRGTGGRLAALDSVSDGGLQEIIAAAGDGDAAIGVKGIALPLADRRATRYVAHVLPLASAIRRRAGASNAAVAAIFVREATLELISPPEAIAKAFKLTPTELRILLAIVEVGGVPEVAMALGIAESTVKTHLGRLFEKTGAKRQADLVKILASYASPAG